MIRIGFSRWLIEVRKTHLNFGQVSHSITLHPEAYIFKIFTSEWKGIHHSMVEKEVSVEPVFVESIDDSYGMDVVKEMKLIRKLADEAATNAVYKCYSSGILAHRPPDPNDHGQMDGDTSRSLLVYIVEQAIMRVASSGEIETPEILDVVDLVQHMRELYDQQQAEKRERARRIEEERQQRFAEQAADRNRYVEATATSYDLLASSITKKEKEEWNTKGYITVTNVLGEFRVPVTKHGFVEQYVDGKHVQNHCIVFQDGGIPPGDEALMKIVLLKIDPQKFMRKSNKMPIRRW